MAKPQYPLAGHKGDCNKVLAALFNGSVTGRCTCGAEKARAA